MSKLAITKALKEKGLFAEVEFIRGSPTPSGYANGWDVFLEESSKEKLFDAGFRGVDEPDCANVTEVLEWVDTLPDCSRQPCCSMETGPCNECAIKFKTNPHIQQ